MTKLNIFSLVLFCLTLISCNSIAANTPQTQLKNDNSFSSTTSNLSTENKIKSVDNQAEVTQKPQSVAQQTQSSAPIQIQPGPKEMQVELLSAKVTGKVLTVTIRYVPGENVSFASTNYPIEQVSYIEDATAKQYGVLQDQSGLYLASPKTGKSSNEIINLGVSSSSGAAIAWFKFPAPSPEAQTVSINIPQVAPFDGVTIQR